MQDMLPPQAALQSGSEESRKCDCRPVAFSAGATDEISHSMGQQRVQLGMHVVATAVPADDKSTSQPEDVVLYFGIIDILQVSCMLQHLPFRLCAIAGSAFGQGPHCNWWTGQYAERLQARES